MIELFLKWIGILLLISIIFTIIIKICFFLKGTRFKFNKIEKIEKEEIDKNCENKSLKIKNIFDKLLDFNLSYHELNVMIYKLNKFFPFYINKYIRKMNSYEEECLLNSLKVLSENKKVSNHFKLKEIFKKSIVPIIVQLLGLFIVNLFDNFFKIEIEMYVNSTLILSLLLFFLDIFIIYFLNNFYNEIIVIQKDLVEFMVIDKNDDYFFNDLEKIKRIKISFFNRIRRFFLNSDFKDKLIFRYEDEELEKQSNYEFINIFLNLVRLDLNFSNYYYYLYKLSNSIKKEKGYNSFEKILKNLSNVELMSIYLKIMKSKTKTFYNNIVLFSESLIFCLLFLFVVFIASSVIKNSEDNFIKYFIFSIFFILHFLIYDVLIKQDINIKVENLIKEKIEVIFQERDVNYKKYFEDDI